MAVAASQPLPGDGAIATAMAFHRAARHVLRFHCAPIPPSPTVMTSSSFSLTSGCNALYYHRHRHRHRHYHSSLMSSNFCRKNHSAIIAQSNAVQDYSSVREVVRSPDLVDLEYSDLNLTHKVFEEVGHIRIRQHVNPLRSTLSVPAKVPDWNLVFKDPTLPLVVDIGCDSFFALRGILVQLVKRANFWVEELALCNVYFIFANATVSLQQLVSSYPGPLVLVFILCPDPHFKRRHHKRRVVQNPLVDSIMNCLALGGQVFVQSDVLEVALDMRSQFDALSNLLHMDAVDPTFHCDQDGWLLSNPMGIRTEREIHAELEGAKIYRRMYQKTPS